MDDRWIGSLIRTLRLQKDWSQEGLCRGICAVSYLSKIEQGKADCSPEVRRLLLTRLCGYWFEDTDGELRACTDAVWDSILQMDQRAYDKAIPQFRELQEKLLHSPLLIDAQILSSWDQHAVDPAIRDSDLSGRQKMLYLILTGQSEEAVRLFPSPFSCFEAGLTCYERGDYSVATEYLQRSYELAAQEGLVYLMLRSRLFLGNCCSNLLNQTQMEHHYAIAQRIANAVGDTELLQSIRYNRGATALELGRYEQAMNELKGIQNRSALLLHKLAICHEQLGNVQDAIACLEEAASADTEHLGRETADRLCDVVRYRLQHPDYLHRQEYGDLLLPLFGELRASFPHGYAAFHLPYVLAWYKANRQYKQALELMSEFPHPTRIF